jgi:hypothetical protein
MVFNREGAKKKSQKSSKTLQKHIKTILEHILDIFGKKSFGRIFRFSTRYGTPKTRNFILVGKAKALLKMGI